MTLFKLKKDHLLLTDNKQITIVITWGILFLSNS